MSDYDEILISIRRIMRAVDLQSKRLMKSSGLTAPQLVLMQSLRREGHMSPSALARDVSLSQATVTSILDRLEKAGYSRRDRSETDKRIVYACLTAEGLKKLEEAPELLQSGFLREYRKLEEWERTQLISSLQRVATMMDAEDLDASPILEVGDLQVDKK
ncbi:MarR family winged helix-turn-helix transcriptional regulator [Paremcibacter congregatus]|uniref:Transcriptional regulator n=1 Tax=Paremcibacter congregatus TaxID=2043170 RepID=A0A2G4YLU2_9PROT|nr:MarR family transcriptional regulator [Paremcibacter congregatus]PHZ83282.1 transcriptional regulator [Paremcibacter congregatus]QDE28244.1 MarR family transcriptional regulator [Paremcibacter congregatus]|tara:strand:- start:925 stop:1404 length:480 start_codon:yes stop_codon:yes gene_type:complete